MRINDDKYALKKIYIWKYCIRCVIRYTPFMCTQRGSLSLFVFGMAKEFMSTVLRLNAIILHTLKGEFGRYGIIFKKDL